MIGNIPIGDAIDEQKEQDKLFGHYEVVYSPDEGGWYSQLWWRDGDNDTSPLFDRKEKARSWARERGGEVEHNKK